jgi:hypothetical protein
MPPVGARAAHRARVAEVLDLHAAGQDVRSIATRLGITVPKAAKLLDEGIRTAMPGQTHDGLRATSELRLDRLARIYGELLTDPDARVRLAAANGMKAVEDSRARLLGTWMKPPPRETEDAR